MTDPLFRRYSEQALQIEARNAIQWIAANGYGAPRNWSERIEKNLALDLETDSAPPIAAYEWLESMGLIDRVQDASAEALGRVMFKIATDTL